MARTAKKEQNLTIDEKLDQALVPDVEQPYRIPKNWCWINLLNSFDNLTDSKRKVQQNNYLQKGRIAVVDQGQETIGGYTDDENMLFKGKLPIIVFGDHTRCIKYIDFPFAQGADGVKILSPKGFYIPKAFYYALQTVNIPNMGYRRHYPLFKDYCIPLLPFAEQKRIVERIESLFAKLDEAKEKVQSVVDGFEDRKAAILHKAFTGELTAKWRNKNQINKKQWMSKQLFAITENFDSKRIPLSKNERENLAKCYDYYGASGVIDQVDRYLFDGKYLLIGEDGANLVSRSTPIAFIAKGKFWVNNHAHVLSVKEEILMEFLCYYINSISLIPYVTGSAQPKMTQAKMNTIPIPVPTIDEQQEIINTLDGLFAEEKKAKEAAEQVRDQIDSMKKSILARAFRGELGTNDPNDEPAIELLKRVLVDDQIDNALPKTPRKRTIIPREIEAKISTGLERDIIKLFAKTDNRSISIDTIMAVSSKKFDILDTLRVLEKKGLIHKTNIGEYTRKKK